MSSFPISIASAADIGGGRVQQDYVRIDGTKAVLCDGHGPRGHEFAKAVCDFQIAEEGVPTDVFAKTDAHIRLSLGPDRVFGTNGTSCTSLYVDPITRLMTVANIGDSTARYWDDVGAGFAASTEHAPSQLGEFRRIQKSGGACCFHDATGQYPKGKQPVFTDDTYNVAGGYYYKNCRKEFASYFETVVSDDDIYGFQQPFKLAMTRAFGDWPLVSYGLIAEPAVNVVSPPAEGVTRVVVLASDGLWDVMTDEDIGAIVRRQEFLDSRDAEKAVAALMEATLAAGRKLFGANADNVSMVVVYL